MNKPRVRYECTSCGASFPKWVGRCSVCGTWDSMVQKTIVTSSPSTSMPHRIAAAQPSPEPVLLSSVAESAPGLTRLKTGIGELDGILGGGLVPGSLLLLGGDPGIGKSTLMLQLAASLAQAGANVLYLSGEESASQIGMRASLTGLMA